MSVINFQYIRNTALLIAGLCYFAVIPVSGQTDVKIRRSEFKTDSLEGFREAWDHIKKGEHYYEQGKGTFRLAREHFLKAHACNPENAGLNYKTGVCYLFSDEKYEALEYLTKAYVLDKSISEDIHYLMGKAHHQVLEFDEAIMEYNAYRKTLKTKKLSGILPELNHLIDQCMNGKKLVENPIRVIITNLGDSINSVYDDYFSVFGPGDTIMYFTSRRPARSGSKRSPVDNKFYESVYVSYLRDNEWTGARPLSQRINSRGNEAAVGINNEGDQLYIYIGDKNSGDIYYSTRRDGRWSSPRSMPARFNSRDREGDICFDSEGRTLFFTSADKKNSFGGRDIFVSSMDSKGRWSEPENLGDLINTTYDEIGVFLAESGKELYFSSKGHNSMGGYDIFRSVLNDKGEWMPPENLGYPMNTPDHDLFYSITGDGKYGYYSTIRMGGIGGKDIFRVVFLGSEKELVMSTEQKLISGLPGDSREGFFDMPVALAVDSSLTLKGTVTDAGSDEPIMAKLEFIDLERSEVIATAVSNDTGFYKISLPDDKSYGVEIMARDYLFFLDMVDLSGAGTDIGHTRDFQLDKVEVGAKVVLENIYFETNKAELKPESYKQLDQIFEFMDNNPTLKLEISGHTDNVGSLKYNTRLSKSRAQAVVSYLVRKGIDPDKLDAQGYAFTQPIAPNDTSEGREKNRRVEFKILSK